IFGAIPNSNLTDEVIVTVIATGFDGKEEKEEVEKEDELPRRKPSLEDTSDYDIPSFLRSKNY
ncbi:MAG: cell division protein FtsZ, partial [Bacilli bacterium]|nr:cell division protein FtsZ [Bacilli bacterium]